MGTITEYEQPPAGLQFVIDPFYPFSTIEGEPVKVKFVITENTIWHKRSEEHTSELQSPTTI